MVSIVVVVDTLALITGNWLAGVTGNTYVTVLAVGTAITSTLLV